MEGPCNVSDWASCMLADSSLLFILISPAFYHLPLLVCHSACIVCRWGDITQQHWWLCKTPCCVCVSSITLFYYRLTSKSSLMMYMLSPPAGSVCCVCDTWKFVFLCTGVPFWAALRGLFITILNVYLGYCAQVRVCVYVCFPGCYEPQLVDSRQTSLVKTKQDVHFVCYSTLIDIDLFAHLAGLKVCFVPSPTVFPPPRQGSQSVLVSAAFLFLKRNPLSIPSSLKHH